MYQEKSISAAQGATFGIPANLGQLQASSNSAPESEITWASRQLDHAIERLIFRVESLNSALSPVLHQTPTVAKEGQKNPSRSTSSVMGSGIMNVTGKIEGVSDRLELILNTLAL